MCNEDSQWYNTLAIGDGPAPLMLFGLSSPYFSYAAYGDLSYAAIADGADEIRHGDHRARRQRFWRLLLR